jgi:uncharacterized protein HemX
MKGSLLLLSQSQIEHFQPSTVGDIEGRTMYSKLIAWTSALVLGFALSVAAFGQTATQENSAAERRHETITDETVQNYAKHQPHMAAALQHLRQAEKELEKTATTMDHIAIKP